ncbi:TIR domain-containing protein [Labedaea rhizosphaerae]|uniref:TIR domain-containing protein n=1 Tax=Labedaea rhizosphaerae TaxID=598644 RepID=UPI001414D3A9|nr:nucleotide-binding protein [Labedaea rhizosphaerae]
MEEYFHVRVSVANSTDEEVKLDLTQETLDQQFLEPYRNGTSITVNGRTIAVSDINRLQISRSENPSSVIRDEIAERDRRSPVVMVGGPSMSWRIARAAPDVTDEYIVGPPGDFAELRATPAARASDVAGSDRTETGKLGDRVFLVHGRDFSVVSQMKTFLRSLGLRIVEWEHAVGATGLPNPYIGDVVRQGLNMADAAVILFTPDDQVRLRADLLGSDDNESERQLYGQARPNVYYEAGIADAIDISRTVLVEVGRVKPFSDAAGRHVVRFDGSPAKRSALAQRLQTAGLAADLSGQDWLTAGAFSAPEGSSEVDQTISAIWAKPE